MASYNVIHRDRVDEDHRAIAADDEIVSRLGAIHVELVLKAGATAALNAHAQHRSARLALEDVADTPCCPFADRDARSHRVPFSGRSYWQMTQRIVKCASQRGQSGHGNRYGAPTGNLCGQSCAKQGKTLCGAA